MGDYALQANDAQVMRAFRIHDQSDLWGFIIRPRHNDNIFLQIEGNKACNEQRAVCSRAGSKRLGNTLTIASAGNNGEDAELPPGGDGVTPVLTFSTLTVDEYDPTAVFKITLDRPALANTTVDFGVYSLTATDPDDYTWVPYQTIEIPQGDRLKNILIDIIDDHIQEPTEKFGAFITNPVNVDFDLPPSYQQVLTSEVTIRDDD